ncbi:MAG: hypothetical protein FK734_12135 [Asgard group archaeon]|nr:hypothetical protein [Asgard group archaeon]
MKVYSLVGKKLIESTPDELMESPVGMIVDEKEEMIRLILTPDARKKQRELLMQESAEFNKNEFAGTFLVSQLENPEIIKACLEEIKSGKADEPEKEKPKPTKAKSKGKKGKSKDATEPVEEVIETTILERWDPENVKKVVNYLDGKEYAYLLDIQELLDSSEGEAYWLTQDLIREGILPGRWVGYSDDQWVYQIIAEQPLSKVTPAKSSSSNKSTSKTTTTKAKKTTTTKKPTSKSKK